MPVNFPPDKPADQNLFPGSSLDQVEGVVDFLLNYDTYMKDRTSIKPMVKPAPPATTSADAAEPVPASKRHLRPRRLVCEAMKARSAEAGSA